MESNQNLFKDFDSRRVAIVKFLTSIQQKTGTLDLAKSTLELCISVIRSSKGKSIQDVIEILHSMEELISRYRVCGVILLIF